MYVKSQSIVNDKSKENSPQALIVHTEDGHVVEQNVLSVEFRHL